MTSIDIHALLGGLARKRPVFHSEADFQFALAWEIREKTELDVRLEFPPFRGERIRLDVWVPDAGLAIELKYPTSELKEDVGGELFALRNQAAGDLGRYDFLKDIMRLERVATGFRDAQGGVAVLLTNDQLHWKPPTLPDNTIGKAFRVHEGRRLHGVMSWSPRAGSGSKKGRESPIDLRDSYVCEWRDYGRLKGRKARHARFRYLALEVSR